MEHHLAVVHNVCSHTGKGNEQVMVEIERIGIAYAQMLEQLSQVFSPDESSGVHVALTYGHACAKHIGVLFLAIDETLVAQIFFVGDDVTPVLLSHH